MISKKQRHFARTDPTFFARLHSIAQGKMLPTEEHEHRARRVFEAFAWGTQAIANGETGLTEEWKDWMDKTIQRDLDHRSIHHFVEMILEFQEGMAQSEKALLGHAENHALRDEIYAWLDANKTASMSMDAAASAMAGKVVPLAWRTVRDHVGQWKKVRSAGKA